jgi:hypothetical protein
LKRAYGDWSRLQNGWKDTLANYGIRAIHQPNYAIGKNAADIALVIDAMDLLHGKALDGFCIISSDSDFTGLAHRLTEAGLAIFGFGEKKTPKAFVSACQQFFWIEELEQRSPASSPVSVPPQANQTNQANQTQPSQAKSTNSTCAAAATPSTPPHPQEAELSKLLKEAYCKVTNKNDWVEMTKLLPQLQKSRSVFRCKDFGCSSLKQVVEQTKLFELRQKTSTNAQQSKGKVEIKLRKAA